MTASEAFLSDVQNHQGRFSRENNTPIPNAILVVNHSTAFDPARRAGRFYRNADIPNRCAQQAITVIDSFALFQMCQTLLQGKASASQPREFIQRDCHVVAEFKGFDD